MHHYGIPILRSTTIVILTFLIDINQCKYLVNFVNYQFLKRPNIAKLIRSHRCYLFFLMNFSR